MRKALLATTFLALALPAAAQTITPGQGTLTDAAGNTWLITASGSITENNQYTPGGGGTSALTIGTDGTVYGQDAHGRGWFALSGNGQYWGSVSGPGALSNQQTPKTNLQTQQPLECATGIASSGQFGIADGQIYGPDGINVLTQSLNAAAPTLTQQFPGLNFVRVPVYYDPNTGTYPDPSQFAAAVKTLTSQGVVVEFENHSTSTGSDAGGGNAGGQIFTGQLLAADQKFYTSFGSYYSSNPCVWGGSTNEPPDADLNGLAKWQLQEYNWWRGSGATANNSPFLFEASGYNAATFNAGLPQNLYANVYNGIIDLHEYGQNSNFSTNLSTVQQDLTANVQGAQRLTDATGVMPVIIGEYGTAMDGNNVDPNGTQTVQAVLNLMSTLGVGSAAWLYQQGPADALLSGDGLSQIGRTIVNGWANSETPAGSTVGCSAQLSTLTPSTATLVPQNTLASIAKPAMLSGAAR
jgi:hypothetical protein